MKTTTIARAIERHLLREREEKPNAPRCHACGRSYWHREPPPDNDHNRAFCSSRCRQAYDAGLPAHDADYAGKSNPRWYSLSLGARGFLIHCLGCGERFDSVGLRCCSPKCESTFRERQERERLLTDISSFRANKRKCAECDAIPNWRNGRRVRATTKFCCEACQAKAARKRRNGPQVTPGLFCRSKREKSAHFMRVKMRSWIGIGTVEGAQATAEPWLPRAWSGARTP